MRKFLCSVVFVGLLALGAGNVLAADNDPLMDTVKDLYGTPYKASGTSKKGFDCSGFTRYVFDALGVELPHSSASQYQVGTKVDKADLQPGDLVFFKTNGRSISHVGIYIGDNTFVHADSSQGVIKTKLNDPYYWSKRYAGATRVAIPALTAQSEAKDKSNSVQAASIETPPATQE